MNGFDDNLNLFKDKLPLVASASGATVNGKTFGATFEVIAGPCSVESEDSVVECALAVKKAGATMLRGGAFKPRTSPYAFQGLKKVGLDYLVKAGRLVGLPTVSEIMSVRDIDAFADVDVLQIGARDMHNYELLREVGRSNKPVLLKRGFSSTIEEWLSSAEYILSEGNGNVILCERGVRNYAAVGKGILDFAAVDAVKSVTGLPVIVDPSHVSPSGKGVGSLALAAAAVGADGVMIETHISPCTALSDAEHQITPSELETIVNSTKTLLGALGRQTADKR